MIAFEKEWNNFVTKCFVFSDAKIAVRFSARITNYRSTSKTAFAGSRFVPKITNTIWSASSSNQKSKLKRWKKHDWLIYFSLNMFFLLKLLLKIIRGRFVTEGPFIDELRGRWLGRGGVKQDPLRNFFKITLNKPKKWYLLYLKFSKIIREPLLNFLLCTLCLWNPET